ncbi:MAG: hypothetical protein COA94_09185 [Rickettsiales bacterium]|nr:MAG: hypothetical protein COA94_09185 [Rickettsiales bacterium]
MSGVDIIIGPMFSGKTTELFETLNRQADIQHLGGLENKTLLILHEDDVRKEQEKNRNAISKNVITIRCTRLSDLNVENFNIIGIDEGQFFPDINKVVRSWMLTKRVIVASLCGDHKTKTFGEVYKLIPVCSSIKKKLAICLPHIQRKGIFNVGAQCSFRLSFIHGKPQKLIGGYDKYMPVCIECYNEMKPGTLQSK